jgi:hypothetical protein
VLVVRGWEGDNLVDFFAKKSCYTGGNCESCKVLLCLWVCENPAYKSAD